MKESNLHAGENQCEKSKKMTECEAAEKSFRSVVCNFHVPAEKDCSVEGKNLRLHVLFCLVVFSDSMMPLEAKLKLSWRRKKYYGNQRKIM
jgi:hypothetical protein